MRPCLHVFIGFLHGLYGFGVVLLFLVKIGCENIIERRGGVLAVPSGLLFQLGLTFRLEGAPSQCPQGKDFLA